MALDNSVEPLKPPQPIVVPGPASNPAPLPQAEPGNVMPPHVDTLNPLSNLNEPVVGEQNMNVMPPPEPVTPVPSTEGSHLGDTIVITPEMRAELDKVKAEVNAPQNPQAAQAVSPEPAPAQPQINSFEGLGSETGMYIPPIEENGNGNFFVNQKSQQPEAQAPASTAPQKTIAQRLMFWRK
jgi:hypothetical protein